MTQEQDEQAKQAGLSDTARVRLAKHIRKVIIAVLMKEVVGNEVRPLKEQLYLIIDISNIASKVLEELNLEPYNPHRMTADQALAKVKKVIPGRFP